MTSFVTIIIGVGIAVAVAICVYVLLIRPWHLRWGATDAEVQRSLPADDLVPNPDFEYTQAIAIQASPIEVWPWLVQIGYKRAGWYSHDWIHRILGIAGSVDDDRRSAKRIIPELQDLEVGDVIEIAPDMGFTVASMEPDRVLVTEAEDASWVWFLDPVDEGTTRLIVRFRQDYKPGLANSLMFGIPNELGSLLMQPKTLRGIRDRAEAAAGRQGE